MPLTTAEREQVDHANASGRPPLVLVHGLWLLASSWDRWAARAEEAGYAPVRLDWPGDALDVAAARADSSGLAGRTVGEVADHGAEVVAALDRPPALIGHSFGGLLVQILAGRGLARATVAIAPAPFRGVLPLPLSALRASAPVLANPRNAGRTVPLTLDQFRYGFANAVDEAQAARLHEEFAVPAPGRPLFQAATANLNPATQAKVRTTGEDRGPLLVLVGSRDHQAPPAIARASFRRQRRNRHHVTEYAVVENRGHSIVVDDGWSAVAEQALAFLDRFRDAPAAG
jgi:pimeloyl-ACP methyl ester carboxylesterase